MAWQLPSTSVYWKAEDMAVDPSPHLPGTRLTLLPELFKVELGQAQLLLLCGLLQLLLLFLLCSLGS